MVRLILARSLTTNVVKAVIPRGLSTAARQERDQLLKKIYAPFSNLEKDSREYNELAISGKVWENYHEPANSEKKGYMRLQEEHASLLREIDSVRKTLNPSAMIFAKQLVSDYALQSVQIEDNRLEPRDSALLFDALTGKVFNSVDMASLLIRDIYTMALPDVTHLSPNAEKEQVIELRNHLVASQWIAETASRKPGTAGLGEKDARMLSALTMKGLHQDGHYQLGWGGRVRLGDYRNLPISVRSNHLRIFPYHIEVPACMQRFFRWRDEAHQTKIMHPLILACQITAYFVHIHPFPDGNGRVSRMMMHDYLVRQGYLPVVIPNLDRQDYLRMISNALDGKPDEFVSSVLKTELEELQRER